MKLWTIAVLSVGGLAGMVVYVNRPVALPVSPAGSVREAACAPVPVTEAPAAVEPAPKAPESAKSPTGQTTPTRNSTELNATLAQASLETTMLARAVDTLVAPQVTYKEKRAVYQQLRETGKLDLAISELEQRMTAQPEAAEYPAALGHAYLKKCETLQDIREQAMLAMQADKAFDAALSLDPSNWEARYAKAVGMSHWPASLNKQGEVIEQFQTLILQQERQAPQPQFAESYLWLGDQYQKAGQSDDARTVWERGASLFPQHEGLKNKLAPANAAPVAGSANGR